MGDCFGGFSRSRLGAFIRSQLGARGPCCCQFFPRSTGGDSSVGDFTNVTFQWNVNGSFQPQPTLNHSFLTAVVITSFLSERILPNEWEPVGSASFGGQVVVSLFVWRDAPPQETTTFEIETDIPNFIAAMAIGQEIAQQNISQTLIDGMASIDDGIGTPDTGVTEKLHYTCQLAIGGFYLKVDGAGHGLYRGSGQGTSVGFPPPEGGAFDIFTAGIFGGGSLTTGLLVDAIGATAEVTIPEFNGGVLSCDYAGHIVTIPLNEP